MGLSPLLVNTYRRYKRGTEKFVQWLAETARLTGTVSDVFSAKPEQLKKGGGRPKGKNRKENKQPRSYNVPINVFVRLAEAIVTKGAQVPTPMLAILQDVIGGRKSCAAWFLANQSEVDENVKQHNEKHQYFISVLEDVLGTLASGQGQKKDKPKPSNMEQEKSTTDRLANIFEYLELEDIQESTGSEWLPDIPAKTKPKVKPKAKPVEYKLEQSDEDISFAIYCFLKDATTIRLFIRRTWREFKSGAIDLQTAALTMNAGIKMIENMNTEFQAAFPQFKDHGAIHDWLINGFCNPDKEGDIFVEFPKDEDWFSYEEGGQKLYAKTMLCVLTLELLYKFVVGTPVPPDKVDRKCRLSHGETVLIQCLFQLIVIGRMPHTLRGDQVGKAVMVMANGKAAPTWAVFAVQIYWDTQRELRSQLQLAKTNLDKCARWLIDCYDKYFQLERPEEIGMWHTVNREAAVEAWKLVKHITTEDVYQEIIDIVKPKTRNYDYGAYFLLRNHPALCGLIAHELIHQFHYMAYNMAGDQGMCITVAHLYNAAHQTGLLPQKVKWADMEWFTQGQGEAWIFVGNRPESRFRDRLALARGFSAKTLAKDRRLGRTGDIFVKGKNRRLRFISRYAELSVEREAGTGKPVRMTKAQEDIGIMAELLAADYLDAQESSDGSSGRKPKSNPSKSHTLTPIETLTAFKDALKKDELSWQFNTMFLFLRCTKLLRRIHTYCIENAPLDHPKELYIRKNGDLNRIVQELFDDLAGRPRFEVSQFPLAVRFLREVIEQEGSVELDEAKDRMVVDIGKDESSAKEPEPRFENPPEDFLPLSMRNMFSAVFVQDDNGDVRSPFGLG